MRSRSEAFSNCFPTECFPKINISLHVTFLHSAVNLQTTQDLIEHLNSCHGYSLQIEKETFKSWNEFVKWKETGKRMGESWSVKQRGDKRAKHHKTFWFYCNRTGDFQTKGKGKRALKSQRTSKTGCSCPAYITARTEVSTGQVTAEFCISHVGHRKDVANTRISKDMHSCIAAKLAQGVNMNAIMDLIRDSQAGPLNRDHLTTCSDLHNIKHQYNISCMQKYQDDANSVLHWVAELEREEHNDILCFKHQRESSDHAGIEKNDFLLGIQTKFQEDMFKRYARKLVSVDAMRGTNAYDFQLVTVPVVDDYDKGIPVAFLKETKKWLIPSGIRERYQNRNLHER